MVSNGPTSSSRPLEEFQILLDRPLPGNQNMEIDRSWLERAETSREHLTVIRFYCWDKPTVSLGMHQQPAEAVDLVYCVEAGIPTVSRPTGGRAVLHGHELTYSIVSNDAEMFPMQGLIPVYQLIAECLESGLRELGIGATHSNDERRSATGSLYDWTKPCFISPSRHELVYKGRKMVGSAQRRLKSSFLQHGSVPIEIDYEMMGRALRFDVATLRRSMISVSEAAGRTITFEELARTFEFSFQQRLSPKNRSRNTSHYG
jgi:lipoate-protein ligase A